MSGKFTTSKPETAATGRVAGSSVSRWFGISVLEEFQRHRLE